jgi:transcriptional regulator with XRE-family HTH domain
MLGWPATELAQRAGVSPKALARLERGEPVRPYIAGAVVRALNEGLAEMGHPFIPLEDFEGIKIADWGRG